MSSRIWDQERRWVKGQGIESSKQKALEGEGKEVWMNNRVCRVLRPRKVMESLTWRCQGQNRGCFYSWSSQEKHFSKSEWRMPHAMTYLGAHLWYRCQYERSSLWPTLPGSSEEFLYYRNGENACWRPWAGSGKVSEGRGDKTDSDRPFVPVQSFRLFLFLCVHISSLRNSYEFFNCTHRIRSAENGSYRKKKKVKSELQIFSPNFCSCPVAKTSFMWTKIHHRRNEREWVMIKVFRNQCSEDSLRMTLVHKFILVVLILLGNRKKNHLCGTYRVMGPIRGERRTFSGDVNVKENTLSFHLRYK